MGCSQSIEIDSEPVIRYQGIVTQKEPCYYVSMECGHKGGYGCILKMNDVNTKAFQQLKDNTYQVVVHRLNETREVLNTNINQYFDTHMHQFNNDQNGFKFLHADSGKFFLDELDGIQLAYKAWGDNFFHYTTFPQLGNSPGNSICALEFIPSAYNQFRVGVKYNVAEINSMEDPYDKRLNLSLSRIFLFPQTFCGDTSSLAYKYHNNEDINYQKLYIDLYAPLKLLHDSEIVHHDIKMGNIVECNGSYKLIDFGLTQEVKDTIDPKLIPAWAHPSTNNKNIDLELKEVFEHYNWYQCKTNPYVLNDMFNFFMIFVLFKLKYPNSEQNKAFENTFKSLMEEACMSQRENSGGHSMTLSKIYNKYCQPTKTKRKYVL